MKLLLMSLLFLPLFAAAHPKIKVSSFVMTDNDSQSTTAELCGNISDKEIAHDKVVITSDPKDNKGFYVVNVGPQGDFCHIIRTVTGTAQVDAYSRSNKPVSYTHLTLPTICSV